MDFAAPRTELSLASGLEKRLSAPMRGLKTCSHGGVDRQYLVETVVCNEVWMVVIVRNLVRSLCR